MRSPPQLTAEALLREGAALRALARRMLDDARADDLVQDTFVAALRGREPRGAVGAWLGAIGRRLALLTRRRQARAQVREALAATARDGVAPSAAEAAASAEWAQRTATAVQQLAEPYRTTVVLRFWHDLPPRAIAQQLRVPVNTVQSRLHRALGLLRERLDEGGLGRGAWIGPLSVLARTHAPVAAGIAAFAAAGAGSMATKGYVVLAAGVLVAASWWVVRDAAPDAATPRTTAGGTHVVASLDEPAAGSRIAAGVNTTTIRGRCITADAGVPVAGCRVGLIASRRGDGVVAVPQSSMTDREGRFTFAPVPSATAHRLFVGVAHLVALERSWQELPPGGLDLGDVQLPKGALLSGTVRDERGNGVGAAAFELTAAAARDRSEGFAPSLQPPLPARGDGVLLHGGCALEPGEWRVALRSDDYVLRSAPAFAVAPGQTRVVLDLVVESLAGRPAIAGTAVDERGAPLANVVLHASDGSRGQTARDGAFVIRRRSDAEAPVRLVVTSPGNCALAEPEAEYSWGSRDHHVVVRQPAGLWLEVVSEETGEPLTDYSVWLGSLDRRESARGPLVTGHHEGGRVGLPKVAPGRYRIVVVPGAAGLLPSEPVEATLAADTTVRVAIRRPETIEVRVQTAVGELVANSRVDLFRQEGESDGELRPGRIGGLQLAYQTIVSTTSFPVLSSARTDARGGAQLAAPAAGRLGLRVRGAHVPTVIHPLPARVAGVPFVVTVERGATIAGRLSPAALLADLVPARDAWQRDVVGGEFGDPARPWPTIQLRATGRSSRVLPERLWVGQPGFPVRDDGSFRIEGVPAGDWRVELLYGVGKAQQQQELGAVAGLVDGETREAGFDIASLAPGELRATITLDGRPAANSEVRFGQAWLRTDGDGRLVARVAAGARRRVELVVGGAHQRVLSDEPIAVGAGQQVDVVVALTRRRLRLHVLRADGTPVTGQVFSISGMGGEFRSDGGGWIDVDPAPPWEFELCTSFDAAARGGPSIRKLSGPMRMPLDRRSASVEVRLVE